MEYSAAYHCNLKCARCSHVAPFSTHVLPPVESFARDLERLGGAPHAEDIRLVGGEPLLHPDIVELLKAARASGIADQVMVTTNGVLLNSMKDDFWENVDFVWPSQYPGASPKDKMIERFRAKADASNTRFEVDPTFFFRTTSTTEPLPDDWTSSMIFRTCGSAHRFPCHMIHEGYLYKCACPPFMPDYLARMGRNGYDSKVDGLDIHASTDLLEDLKAYLYDQTPLNACRKCLGYVGKWQPHRQLARDTVAHPETEPITRSNHLDRRKLARDVTLYYIRRSREALTGRPQW